EVEPLATCRMTMQRVVDFGLDGSKVRRLVRREMLGRSATFSSAPWECAMRDTVYVRPRRARAAGLVATVILAAGAEPSHATMLTYDPPGGAVMVPPGVTQMTFDLYGAQGGGGIAFSSGGLGGRATATIAVTPGTMLLLTVGRAGDSEVQPGYNGGGAHSPSTGGGNGGGSTGLRLNDGITKLLVAGGGGRRRAR